MKLPRPLLAAVIAVSAAAVLAPTGAHAQVANPWTFTTAAWTPRVAAAPSTVADSIAFDVVANGVAATKITAMSFMVMGTTQPGDVAAFTLVYYPNGLANPGVVVASKASPTWAHGGPKSSIVTIQIPQGIPVAGAWTGSFAVQTDMVSARKFYIQPRLQSVTVNDGTGPRELLETETLPMNGDTYYVN